MHPDKPGYIDELHEYFRGLLVRKLDSIQLQLHDYFSTRDPLYQGADCFDEFPLVDGLPEYLLGTDDDDYEEDDDELFTEDDMPGAEDLHTRAPHAHERLDPGDA